MVKLSASRIKTAEACSWQYYCKYKLKLPERSNDGARRGTVCHAILEVLGRKGRYKYFQQILKKKDIFAIPSIRRLTLILARRLGIDDSENMSLVKKMTLNGLLYDFYGKDSSKLTKAFSEKHFCITVNEEGKKYCINGFIDKLFLYNDSKVAVIRDFKTSKQVYKGKDATDNLQDLMYSLAVKHLYPKYTHRKTEFLFLKFPLEKDLLGVSGTGVLEMAPLSAEELEGFEYQLTEVQKQLDSFDEEAGLQNLAATQPYPSDGSFGGPMLCGKEGFKMRKGEPLLGEDGQPIPAYICSFRKPFKYYVLLNPSGKTKVNSLGRPMTSFEEDYDSLVALQEEGDTLELREYGGCPHWNYGEPLRDEFSL